MSKSANDDTAIRELYQRLLQAWNDQNASAFAAQFEDNGNVVGYDGSLMNGKAEIESSLTPIFADHPTATYVSIVREVRLPGPEAALLRSVVGMVPRGRHELNPERNAIQTVVAVKREGIWRITLFQNTPAQFHGRPDLVQALTDELKALVS
jgi:uncharacterized protein (TIGR02246 family)